jgi:hypothetical protein
MDVSSIAGVATDLSQSKIEGQVQIAVLKKVMDVEAQAALQLVQAAAQVIPTNPPNLGKSVDTFA